jgi:hypothetical protein
MSTESCEREPAVLRAVAAGSWPAELRAHVRSCVACGEAALVAEALRAEAAVAAAEPLPEAGGVWREFLRDGRRRAIERAAWPITVMTRIALGACAVAAVAVAAASWPVLSEQLAGFARTLVSPAAAGAGGVTVAILSIATAITVSAAIALFESWAGE